MTTVPDTHDGAQETASALVSKLRYQDVHFEKAPCPLCGAQEPSAPVLHGRDFTWHKEGEFPLVRCGSCSLVYQHPRPTPETMRYYYEDCYSGDSEENMRKFLLESPVWRLISHYRMVTLEKARKLKPGDAVLDVGASYGAFIEYVRRARDIKAYAIDLDPGSIASFVNKEEIDVRCGDLLEEGYPDETFEVVTLFETLEHVYEPVTTLEEIRRILKPGGLVLIEVPSWDSWIRPFVGTSWLPLLLPTHLQHFSRKALQTCVEKAGFEVAHHQAMFFPVELTASLGTMISRLLGHKRQEEKGPLRKLVDLLCAPFLIAIFLLVDIPLIFLLRILGRSGHQTIIGRKPAP